MSERERAESTDQKVTVVIGAGASYGCADEEGQAQGTLLRPPLVANLFSMAGDDKYKADLFQHYPGALAIASVVGTGKGTGSLEEHLELFALHENPRERDQFKDTVLFLHHLFTKISESYLRVAGYSSYVGLLKRLHMKGRNSVPHNILVICLNYDTLCDKAATIAEPAFVIDSLDSYIRKDLGLSIVKLHGSIDWFYQIQKDWRTSGWDSFENWRRDVGQLDPREMSGREITFANIPSDHIQSKRGIIGRDIAPRGHHQYFPCMTAPLATKSMADTVCPAPHVEYAKEFMRDCKKFLFIGTSFLDVDLIELLSEVRDNIFGGLHHIVEPDPNEEFTANLARRFQIQRHGLAIQPMGFGAYVRNKKFHDFAGFSVT